MDNEINSIKDWSNKDVDTNILNKFLSLAKETYKSEFTKAHLDEEDVTFFAWKQQPLHVYIIRITAPLKMLGFLVFATTTEGSIDHINYFDCIKETDNTQFIQTYSDKDKLKIILKNSKQLKNIVSEDIIGDSIFLSDYQFILIYGHMNFSLMNTRMLKLILRRLLFKILNLMIWDYILINLK